MDLQVIELLALSLHRLWSAGALRQSGAERCAATERKEGNGAVCDWGGELAQPLSPRR